MLHVLFHDDAQPLAVRFAAGVLDGAPKGSEDGALHVLRAQLPVPELLLWLQPWDDNVLPGVELLRQGAVALWRHEDRLLDHLLPVLEDVRAARTRKYKDVIPPLGSVPVRMIVDDHLHGFVEPLVGVLQTRLPKQAVGPEEVALPVNGHVEELRLLGVQGAVRAVQDGLVDVDLGAVLVGDAARLVLLQRDMVLLGQVVHIYLKVSRFGLAGRQLQLGGAGQGDATMRGVSGVGRGRRFNCITLGLLHLLTGQLIGYAHRLGRLCAHRLGMVLPFLASLPFRLHRFL
mmetsp:Transcript_19363/g.49729  ORF Transcript_19363/g.49729 Transcript_19363/m.49729 type:complete len:288 (-) Transcript_19363:171-1034(-)